jgi:hypothetical protein
MMVNKKYLKTLTSAAGSGYGADFHNNSKVIQSDELFSLHSSYC